MLGCMIVLFCFILLVGVFVGLFVVCDCNDVFYVNCCCNVWIVICRGILDVRLNRYGDCWDCVLGWSYWCRNFGCFVVDIV